MTSYTILGGTGFLGINIAIALSKDPSNRITIVGRHLSGLLKQSLPAHVRILKMELNSQTDFKKIFEGSDIIFHLLSSTVPATSNHANTSDFDDIAITGAILDACVADEVKRIIYLSSGGAIYGTPSQNPASENTDLLPISSYGYKKMAIELLLDLYGRAKGLDCKIARLANPYGPFQIPNGRQGIIAEFLKRAFLNEPLIIRGGQESFRDYIYVSDAVDAILRLSTGSPKHNVYNIGSGIPMTPMQIAQIVESITDRKLSIQLKPPMSSDVRAIWLDTKRFESEFGSICTTSLDEGIMKAAQFVKSYLADGKMKNA